MLNHVRNATVWLSLAAVGAGAVVSTPARAHAQETPRKITTRVPPVYSDVARRARIGGTVKLLAIVSPEGNVKSVRTVGGNALFLAAAEAAVRRWKFEPATKETTEAVALKFESPS